MTWDGVRARVERLARHGGTAAVFGAAPPQGHGFRLEPVLPEHDVVAIEERFGARLPPAYRSFVLEVGAFGAGPGYGLFGFRRVDGQWEFAGDRHRGAERVDLRVEFAHRTPFPLTLEPDFSQVPRAEWAGLQLRCDAEVEAATRGTLPLCHTGCGRYDLLVVTGPDRGAV
ncbi:SMI1/KNR4 family protein [Amycolatopsis rhabdoformis]|uniref:SMI1/KNR4 family protein n=1 Tax=Amycolatopsis rhabdoformis TaxID=1448059 RepID=A0ABZ1IFD1_9PSEU|nr:SMI1/KNR4 family protein [Amycolatopsis rhabdoformis]WSE33117.1 SMI1/KNR4 family protein [Amycolatopsis rhabdoformis]